ncbi:MAG: VWA domain-containing protein, partial [Anaerolineales bacterium]|nr:VWA domain-containing protein [Anaerolineales bacterium]
YGPGGYYKTPLEASLPVEMQLKDQERRVNLTMYYVVDKSGSMADTSVGGIPKVELAKEAVIRSLGLLSPMDRAAVVAFDDSAFWVVPPQEVTDPDDMANRVGSIRADGGTDIYAGLLAVDQILQDDTSTLKHIILLTDGGASETGNPELAQKMADEYGATLSVVAIGEGFANWITRLPELAGGRFHFAYDPETIPEIFTQETTLATRAYIIEETFWPTQVQQHPIVSGITAVPPLLGYIGTSPKPAAQSIWTTQQDDPLLAAWHYGLGKSLAWTSDATGRWAVEWVNWAGFPRFWEQAVKWTISQERDSIAETEVKLVDGRAVITIDAAGADGNFINELFMETRVIDPNNQAMSVEMHQVAPGRYQGSFKPEVEGAYLIRVAGSGSQHQVSQSTGWVLNYSPEYLITQHENSMLKNLAQLTGGKELAEPWESLSHDLTIEQARRPIWHWLTLAAILLFPFDVALRRLAIGKREIDKAWTGLQSRLTIAKPEKPAAPRSEPVSRLMQAKQRASQPPEKVSIPATHTLKLDEQAATTSPEPDTGSPRSTVSEPATGALATHLLNSKRRRESKQKDESDHASNTRN